MRAAPTILIALLVAVPACGGASGDRYSRAQAQDTLRSLETPGVVIGEFALANDAVIDGDTIRVDGLDTTLRLLAIDTEETFKNETDRRMAEADFDEYLRVKRGDSKRPVKAATPLGEEATDFARQFFAGVRTVRLERDHPRDIRGRFKRYLAYVWAFKDDRWQNYNVEAVRAGMSPYYTKYGYSRRFHDEFVAAENEARAAGIGIWDPAKQHYRDYDHRKVWWDARAEFIRAFEQRAQANDSFIVLTHWDAPRRLEEHLGKEVHLLAAVSEIRLADKGPTRVLLSRRMFSDFPLIFWDNDIFGSSGVGQYRGEFIVVRGVVSKYRNKYNGKEQLQIQISTPGQITLSDIPGLPGIETSARMD
jgi:endonuclease YncB( thermonuclease family)